MTDDTATNRKTPQQLYDEHPWPRRFTKARKAHRCDVCGHRIEPRALYYAETIYPGDGNDNDDIFTYRAHLDCDVLYYRFGKVMDWEFPSCSDWGYWLEVLDEAGVKYPAEWKGWTE